MKTLIKRLSAAAIMTTALAGSAAGQSFTVGTTSQGSSSYAMTGAIAKVVLDKYDMRLRAMPQGGPTVTLPLVNQGTLNFSIAVSFVASFGYSGKAMFSHIGALKNLRAVAALRILPLGVIVAKDSDVHKLSDFRGHSMPSEFNAQRIMGSLMAAIYEMGGLTASDVNGYPTPTGERALADLVAGKVAGTIYTMDAGLTQEANAKIGIRYISIPNTPKNLAILQKHVPGALIDEIKPAPAYAGVVAPVNAVIAPFLLMANKNVDPKAIEKLLRAIHDNKKSLVTSFAGFKSFNPNKMYQDVGIPYHAGALAYYREIGQVK